MHGLWLRRGAKCGEPALRLADHARRRRIGRAAEHEAVVGAHVEAPRAGVGPLRLVRVDVDAGVRLLVVPAAGQHLAALALACAGEGRADHVADIVAGGEDALDAQLVAARAGAREEQRDILARLGHAELHGAALRAPLLLLFEDAPVRDGRLCLRVEARHLGEARRGLLGRLGGEALLRLLHVDRAPDPVEPRVHQDPDGAGLALHERVDAAVADALLGGVANGHGGGTLRAGSVPGVALAGRRGRQVQVVLHRDGHFEASCELCEFTCVSGPESY